MYSQILINEVKIVKSHTCMWQFINEVIIYADCLKNKITHLTRTTEQEIKLMKNFEQYSIGAAHGCFGLEIFIKFPG